MSECMMSTPNLEGGRNSSDLITSWCIISINGDTPYTVTSVVLPFTPSHLFYYASTECGVYKREGSIDLCILSHKLSISQSNGWLIATFTLNGNTLECEHGRSETGSESAEHYFIAVPA